MQSCFCYGYCYYRKKKHELVSGNPKYSVIKGWCNSKSFLFKLRKPVTLHSFRLNRTSLLEYKNSKHIFKHFYVLVWSVLNTLIHAVLTTAHEDGPPLTFTNEDPKAQRGQRSHPHPHQRFKTLFHHCQRHTQFLIWKLIPRCILKWSDFSNNDSVHVALDIKNKRLIFGDFFKKSKMQNKEV